MKDPTILQNIPVSLRGSPQWVAWKGDKIPVDPKTGRNAKANDPETWGTYRESLKYFRENDEIMGIGYQFSADDAFAGVDLDKCRDPETGKIEPWAQEIIVRLNSYTEVSPSGTGIHIILIGKVPPGGNKKDKIEMYSQTRYFTVTGDHLEGTPTTIEDRQTELSSFHAEIFQQQEQESQLLPAEPPPSPKELSDEELIEKAQQAGNGKKFAKLWRGDLSDYASPSEGTLALLNMLVFWCGPDRVRIDRLFRKSGLMREKWDRPQLRSTWGALEIEKAIAVVKESYDPEKDIKVPEKGKGKNKRIELGINDLEESRLLHAAINFKDEIMGLGFRVDLPDGDTGVTILISDGVIVKPFINPEEIKIDGLSYKITKGSIPPRLEDVWDLKRLKIFLERPSKPGNLYRDIVESLHTYIDLPDSSYGLLAAWTVGTYFAHLFAAFPFLHFFGPKETGKSKSLEALRFLCFNAWKGRDVSVPALGDTVDGMRGTMLIDQAESLPENLVGILADSYKKAGGRRRVVEITKKGRTVLEFSTYGPKGFASTKDLDSDLKDRCIRVPMVRTKKPLPDLEGGEPVWAELRDKLYRFALRTFKEVQANYLATPGDGTRITELWRPIRAVLQALKVSPEEIEIVRGVFLEGAQETRYEPTGWELTLLESLRDRAAMYEGQNFVMGSQEIIAAMEIEGDIKPTPKWVGNILSEYGLYVQKRRAQTEGKKRTEYIFDSGRVVELCSRYLRDNADTDVSPMSPDDIYSVLK